MEETANVPNKEFVEWACERELRFPNIDTAHWAIEEAKIKTAQILDAYANYISPQSFKLLEYNLILHFIICTPFEVEGEGGEIIKNPLYEKYGVEEKSKGIVSSASDESSSASLHISEAYNAIDFVGMDLISTPYGKYAYAILSSIQIYPALL